MSQEQKVGVGGMTCQGCVRRVTEVITQNGAQDVKVDLAAAEARFVATPEQTQVIREALDADGWEVRPET